LGRNKRGTRSLFSSNNAYRQTGVSTKDADRQHTTAAGHEQSDTSGPLRGDRDVLSASYNEISWYENADGKGAFGEQRVISTEASGAASVETADVDRDGDLDLLSASDDRIAWYENTDGKGSFGEQRVISRGVQQANSVAAMDIDGDGDLDVLSASSIDAKIAWYENRDGKDMFGPQKIIRTSVFGAAFVTAEDVDGDGDMDVLSASTSEFGGSGIA
jgi:hypothetical protein